jgi:hypothetical protein
VSTYSVPLIWRIFWLVALVPFSFVLVILSVFQVILAGVRWVATGQDQTRFLSRGYPLEIWLRVEERLFSKVGLKFR